MTTAAGAGGSNSEAGAGAGAGKTDEGTGTGTGAAAAGAGAGAGKGAEGKGEGAGAGGKQDEGGAGAGAGKGKEGEGAAGAGEKKAPEKYDFKLPEGGRLTKSDLPRLEQTARANNWTQEEANEYLVAADAELQAISDQWAAETKADKDLGGEKLEATQQLTQKGIDFLFPKGDPHREGFLEFLNRGGAGNNINVVRALARIGKAQSEDGSIGGSGGSGQGPRAPEDVLYKTTPGSSS